MGKPRYKFWPCKGPNGMVVVNMEMLSEPAPTPEKYQRKARTRRLKQQLRDGEITPWEFLDSGVVVREDCAKQA